VPGETRTISPDEPFVQILDPATGTATFLVEAIDVIHLTLISKWQQQHLTDTQQRTAWNEYVAKHLLPRLHAYELMMAPYAIAHMKLGLKLHETGYQFGADERARIYLTNALEPWVQQLRLPDLEALAHEAAAVNEIKRHKRFTVVMGNPPYAGHSANASRDESNELTFIGRLIEDYKAGCPELFKPAQAKWLQDDYVKFIRFAEQTLAGSQCRILGYITNHSYLNNPTFRGMRRHLCATFESLRLLDLHGNIKRVEGSNFGAKDENVFDIQQGVAIQLSYYNGVQKPNVHVWHADLWGTRSSKYATLTNGTALSFNFDLLSPKEPLFLFVPRNEDLLPEYERGWRVPEIFSLGGDPAPGIVSTHDEFAFAFTKNDIFANVDKLLATRSEAEARQQFRLCSQAQWDYRSAKRELASRSWKTKCLTVLYRPFDFRFTINDSNVAVHRRERVLRHMIGLANLALCTNRQVNGAFGMSSAQDTW
jgi:predicted helicase